MSRPFTDQGIRQMAAECEVALAGIEEIPSMGLVLIFLHQKTGTITFEKGCEHNRPAGVEVRVRSAIGPAIEELVREAEHRGCERGKDEAAIRHRLWRRLKGWWRG